MLVYPGGDYEVHRPSWEAGKVDFDGRKGFIKLALEEDVPIVPIVSAGGQETALFLSRGEGLARLLRLDKLFRLKVLPISIALPWILNVGDMLGHIPRRPRSRCARWSRSTSASSSARTRTSTTSTSTSPAPCRPSSTSCTATGACR